jgi:hypothetical protein
LKTILKFLVIICLAAVATGCATGPKFAEVKDSIVNLSPEEGRIFLYRTTTLGAALTPQIKVNGEPVGKSVAKGFMFIDREPGSFEVMTSTEVDRKLSLTLEKGQTRFVKFGVTMGFFVGHVYPNLVDSEVGNQEIQKCSYTGPQL